MLKLHTYNLLLCYATGFVNFFLAIDEPNTIPAAAQQQLKHLQEQTEHQQELIEQLTQDQEQQQHDNAKQVATLQQQVEKLQQKLKNPLDSLDLNQIQTVQEIDSVCAVLKDKLKLAKDRKAALEKTKLEVIERK